MGVECVSRLGMRGEGHPFLPASEAPVRPLPGSQVLWGSGSESAGPGSLGWGGRGLGFGERGTPSFPRRRPRAFYCNAIFSFSSNPWIKLHWFQMKFLRHNLKMNLKGMMQAVIITWLNKAFGYDIE